MAKNTTKATEVKSHEGLSKRETAILTSLSKTKSLTRTELKAKSKIASGLTRILGAITKKDGGVAGDTGLVARGFVTARKDEGEPTAFAITATGRKELAKAK
jgi:hypothetical protein